MNNPDLQQQGDPNTQDTDEYQGQDPQEAQQADSGNMTKQIEESNLAEGMSEDELRKIGRECKLGYEADELSRKDWLKDVEKWTDLAKLVIQHKSFPWPNASNVKYPLLATAAMQFAARAYPSLIPSNGQVVTTRIIGKDPDGKKNIIADAVSEYLSYQIMEEMQGWEEEMDRLLIMLPIVGTMFKKTYWDPITKQNCSSIVLPQNIVVDYWAKSMSKAERISEIFEINDRVVKERQAAGLWLKKVDLGEASLAEQIEFKKNQPTVNDDITPYVFIEQHTYLDLDDDEYKEPYIVTFHRQTGKVVRIAARYEEDGVHIDDKGNLVRIDPTQYYTKFGFVPNPDGSFYDIGFGILLGPINESVNTLINQLIDAGTVNNLQSGFIGKGLRLRMGEQRFTPGEWKLVNNTGDDLKKQIVPLPSKEPSKVLFELLQFLVQSGKELASVADIFTGKMPGQNTPATTTMATVEQGMKVFTAIYKRIFRSLGEEYKKLYRLNSVYLNPNTYIEVLDMNIGPDAFKLDDHRIIPGGDPNAVSQQEKQMKAQKLMEMLGAGLPLDPVQVTIRLLQADEQPDWQKLIVQQVLQTGQMPPPPVDPKVQALQVKAQMDAQAGQQQMQINQQSAMMDQQGKAADLQFKTQEANMKLNAQQREAELKISSQLATDHARMATAQMHHQQDMGQQAQQHTQEMQHADQMNTAKVAAVKAQAQAKPSNQGAKK